MKIGVVGCGALGSFYGAKLCRLNPDVHFLLRSDYETVRQKGVRLQSVDGDFHVQPHCGRSPEQIGICDLVLIGLKTTANDQFARLLPPLVGPETAVLTLQNGLGNEEALAALFGCKRVLGGLCFVCLNRVAPGEIHHLAHGDVLLGEYQRPASVRAQQIAAAFRAAGVRCEVTSNLDMAHWRKLVWNVPFNGLGVAGAAGYDAVISGVVPSGNRIGACLTTEDLLGDPRWTELVRELMTEVMGAAARLGYSLRSDLVEDQIERTRRMGAYKASTLIDFERGSPLELNSLFAEPLRRGESTGGSMPRLRALTAVLAQLGAASQ